MLALALERCRELGLDKVLIICGEKNTASAKTIIKNGGVFESNFTKVNGCITRRYWITLTC
jgi:predicted acetyltransferase